MESVCISFLHYDINIVGNTKIERVVIIKHDSDECIIIDTDGYRVNTTDAFMYNYATLLYDSKMLIYNFELLHDARDCYCTIKSRTGMFLVTVNNKYTLYVNSTGNTINNIEMSYGDESFIKTDSYEICNTNDQFIVRIVNALYGMEVMSERKLMECVNNLYHMIK